MYKEAGAGIDTLLRKSRDEPASHDSGKAEELKPESPSEGPMMELPDVTRRTSEPNTLRVTLSSLEGEKDQSSNMFPGFVGIPAILLVTMAFCILWSWNKRKKRQVPYLQVTPSLTLPRPRQRAKNIYDPLPRQQEELGRHHSSVFSTESLLSGNFDSPEHLASQADDAPRMHRAHIHTVEFAVGIYDNAPVPQMCELLGPSAYCINVSASRDGSSISSRESNDYVNIPMAEETAETRTSSSSTPENHFVLLNALELKLIEERQASSGNASDHIRFGDPETESSDGEGSSQTSNDYVNITALDMEENQPCVAFHSCRDYENLPPADPSGSQQQAEEEVPTSNIGCGEGRTHAPMAHGLPDSRDLSWAYYVAFHPCLRSEDSQMPQREEMLSEDSHDYENVLATRGWEQGPGTQLAPDEQTLMEGCMSSSATGETNEEA